MVKGKHKPPSRIRYEERNPIVSCRVSEEIYDKLIELKTSTRQSFADILKVGLGMQEVKVGDSYQKGWRVGHSEGRLGGITDGQKFDLGTCPYCKKPLHWDVSRDKDQEILANAINARGVFHTGCDRR